MKTVAILQSNFLPWKGYFDIIHDVDVFVFFDDVQYTKNDWRNRNRVKLPTGLSWFTVPVNGHMDQKINEVMIDYSQDWRQKHKNILEAAFSKAPYWESYKDLVNRIYSFRPDTLSQLNQMAIQTVSNELGIDVVFYDSKYYPSDKKKTDRLLQLLELFGADVYVSGPAAQDYIEPEKFRNAGIELRYKDYSGYPEYPQLYGGFVHGVTVLDVLFNCGERAPEYIWDTNQQP
jgi:hypothetical protein